MLVECYDPKADQWNILQTPILEGRSGPGCAVLDDSIVLVGGYSWSMVYSPTRTLLLNHHVKREGLAQNGGFQRDREKIEQCLG